MLKRSQGKPTHSQDAGWLRWLNRSLRAQFNLTTILLAVIPVIVVAVVLTVFSVGRAQSALEADAYVKLRTVRNDRIKAVAGYFVEIQSDMSVLLGTVETLRENALTKLTAINHNKSRSLQLYFDNNRVDALDIASDPGVIAGLAALSTGFHTLGETRAQSLYAAKPLLEDAGDRSAYTANHREQHAFFSHYITLHGYRDALLVDMHGDIIYSVRKTPLFGTSLTSGEYKDSPLATLYQGLRAARPDQTLMADAALLEGEQAMFVGAPVYSGTLPLGMFVLQLSFDPINSIVQDRTGLKPGTESYLIARTDDAYAYRSDRVIKTGKVGDPRPNTGYNADAFVADGAKITIGSTGAYEVAVYEPLDIPGLHWAIVTTGAVIENFVPTLAGRTEDFYTEYINRYGYYDLLLIQPDGYVFYSVKQEQDFETNLLTGPYKDSNLGQLVAQVLRTKQYGLADYAFYEPSGGEPAMFAAQPLVSEGRVELIVAVQLSQDDLAAIVGDYTGLDDTGETLLAGPDKLARSPLRMVDGPWVLQRTLDTRAINEALAGKANNGEVIMDYRGIPVFNAWGPVTIAGADFRWALAAKIDQSEALQPVYELRNTIVLGSLVVVAVVAVLAIAIGTTISNRLIRPIIGLTASARAIAEGDFTAKPPALERSDEVGVLSNALNTMVERLEDSIDNLQASNRQVQARTEQLEANQRAIQVVFSASGAFQTDELLSLVVNLIRDRFNLYHVQIYLLDGDKQNAILHQSTGFAGQQLLARKHQIPMERTSLVTTSIKEARPVLVADVQADPNFLPNPLLPDTRSELVVPFKVGDEVLGALDAQSRDAGYFTDDAVTLFETMIGQIGLMFQNAQLFTNITERTEALTIFTNQLSVAADVGRRLSTILDPDYLLSETVELLRSRFGFYHTHVYLLDETTNELVVRAGSGEVGRVLKERRHSIPLDREHSRVARAARDQATQVVNDTTLDSDFQPNPLLPQTRAELSVPLVVGNRVLGVLDIQDDQPDRFGPAERDTFATLAGQLATALDNARLFQESQTRQTELDKRAAELQTVAEVSTAAATILDPEVLLQRVVDLTKANFDLYHAHIYLYDEAHQALVLAAGAGEAGARMKAQGWQIPLDRERSLVVQAFLSRQGVIANDVQAAPDFLPNPLLPQTRAEMAVPLYAGEQVLGVLDVQADSVGRFTPQDRAIQTTLAGQIAAALQNARLFTRQQQAEAAVRELARQNQLVLNSAAEGIFGVDQNGVTVFVNPAATVMLGFSAEELIGGMHHDLIHHHRADGSAYPPEECRVYAAYRDGETHAGEDELYWRKDGTSFPVSYTSTPIKDDDGTILGAVVTFRDITAQQQAQEEINRQVAILNNSSDFIALADLTGRLVYLNLAGARMIGHEKPEDFIGKIIADSHDAEGLRLVEQVGIPAAMQSGFWRGENALRRADGTFIPVDQAIFPVLDAAGKVQYLATIMSDITERKQTEAAMRKRAVELQTVAEVSTAASSTLQTDVLLQSVVDLTKSRFDLYHAHIYLLNAQGDALELAAGAGEPGRQMKAQGWRIPVDRENSLVARACRSRQGVIENDVRTAPDFLPNPLLPDTVSEMAIPIVIGERVLGVLDVQSAEIGRFTAQDVAIQTTLARQVGAALENTRLFEETQGVADKLREVDRLKSEFLANMSHELRTPLNSIIGYTQLLLADLESAISPENYEDLTSIGVNSKHLLGLINDILDLAKIEAGRLELHKEEVEVGVLLDSVQSSNAGLFVNKDLEFLVEAEPDLPLLWADHVRLIQVLNNLISNAAKFTEQGAVTVRAYRDNGDICLAVTDTGIGIAPNDLEDIFEKFRQVDGSFTRRAEGTGLGLPITRYLVQMHGGRVEVRSELGKGSTFIVRLPITPPAAAEAEEG